MAARDSGRAKPLLNRLHSTREGAARLKKTQRNSRMLGFRGIFESVPLWGRSSTIIHSE